MIFFMETEGEAEFAGILIEENKFVSSNNEKNPKIDIRDLTREFWTEHFLYGRRLTEQ